MKNAIVLGGTHDHIRLIEILKEKGYYTYLIDYLENPPARKFADEHIRESALDKEKVLEIAIKNKSELTIALCIDQALLSMAYVSEKMGTPCYLCFEKALSLTNKALMKNIMRQSGIPTSDFLIIKIASDLTDIKFGLPYVVKPADSNSSKGISKIENKDHLLNAFIRAKEFSSTNEVILEQFKEGVEYSVDFFIKASMPQLLLITKYSKSKIHSNKFIITQSYSPTDFPSNLIPKLHQIASNISKAFRISDGPLFIQLLRNDNDINIVEFSSRIGGGSKHHFMKRVNGFDYLKHLIEFTLGKNPSIELNHTNSFTGINFVYANKGAMISLEGFDKAVKTGLIAEYFNYKTIGSDISGSESSADRLLGFIVEGNSFEELVNKSKIVDSQLRVLDKNGNDIMIHDLYF
ncbi:MAG: ATP-grasp domain-containing protein [Bacteroidales bacterium]|nr:ATP-grasp domain-containing protein [Bacteroidales bacterium]